jgi:hypothetical protein
LRAIPQRRLQQRRSSDRPTISPPSRDPLTGAMSVRTMMWEKNVGERLDEPAPQ